MAWREDTSWPIPDWQRQAWPETGSNDVLHAQANSLAAAWVDATAAALGAPYHRLESANFMLLSSLDARGGKVLMDYLERSLRRVLHLLPDIASNSGHGKYVVLVFHEETTYYEYIAHYGATSDQPQGFSSGMFINYGYGHFVFAAGPFDGMEAVVVHELTHCLVQHLGIPAWLNEGLAVNTEHRLKPTPPRYRANELQYLLAGFWNEETIQEFWSGKSFLRSDDGQPLSYELAKLLVQLLDKDYDTMAAFCATARLDDSGEAAALENLGMSLGELAAIVLGPGPWTPKPETWTSGVEEGQFSRSATTPGRSELEARLQKLRIKREPVI